jgi:hypothetical protein
VTRKVETASCTHTKEMKAKIQLRYFLSRYIRQSRLCSRRQVYSGWGQESILF